MKYVITGGAGHISKPLTEKLLAAGHQVTVIGRNADNLKPLTAKGAQAAIGSIDDEAFLEKTFKGADAVYTMIPPNFTTNAWQQYIGEAGNKYARAIKSSGVKNVVNLSSIGAHMPKGCGPVSGLYYAEKALNELSDVNIVHLRPGYFYHNFLGSLGMAKHMNILGANYGGNTKVALSDTDDIADAAAEELLNLKFKGHTVRYLVSDEKTFGEVASVLGKAIGKDLPWVEFKDEDAVAGMKQAGLPEEIAKNFAEMGGALKSGEMLSEYLKNKPSQFGKRKIEDFSKIFAGAYQSA